MASAAATTTETAKPAAGDEPVVSKPPSPFAFLAAMLVLTGLGVGFGGLMGLQLLGKMESAPPGKAETRSAPAQVPTKSRYAANVGLRLLPPIITNLASPERTWVRLEASLVMEGEHASDSGALAAQIAEDIIAFLRTLSLTQIQGASGFQHLREDLNDRARVRSGGRVRDLVIQSMIVE
jgi:flagellar protein FliL